MDHAGGRIRLYAIRRREHKPVVRDWDTRLTHNGNPAHHLASRQHATTALNDEFGLTLPEGEVSTGAEPEIELSARKRSDGLG